MAEKTLEEMRQAVEEIRARMAAAAREAGRSPDKVQLCAACKTRTAQTVAASAALPIDVFGENHVQELVEKTDAGVVFLVKAAAAEQLLTPMSEQGVLLVCKPFSNTLFLQAIHIAAASNHRLLRLRQENAKMQEKIAQVRLVSRAKCCLIEREGMTEADAHRLIEKRAMDTRRDRAEIAQEILDSYED